MTTLQSPAAPFPVCFLLLFLLTASAFCPPISSRPAPTTRTTAEAPVLHVLTQSDFDATFGSANQSTGGVSWGADDDDNEDQDTARDAHQARVAELLEEANLEFKEQRRQSKWGKFANVTNAKDLKSVVQKEKERFDAEHEIKAQLAKTTGVEYTVLEAKEAGSSSSTVWDDTGNIQISAGSKSWFAEVDDELESEWNTLTGGLENSVMMDDVQVDDASGKVVTREAMAGVRVGSAGGWSLEVFPGDFVVHRKYGIGRFERTCLRPKSRLTPEEKKAQEERRGEILTSELRKRKGGVTTEDIQQIRSKFGTEEDTDPVSNPQSTVLEITYADAVVHVPVDRAYRISRYRAGDAVVKPKLSRVRGEAWTKAKKRVEENTLQLAQEVLALYTTREMLQRPPFDPSVESRVAQFEATFPFDPTVDQKKCFEDVENDMVWKSRPMDRLVCGDVGFGKTEVALRALFRTVANGKQAAFLAPTGVLAAQHFRNIQKRMGKFNISITLLRGGMAKNTKVGRELRQKIKTGEIQLIVGTHALLSNDLIFNDLGLLVVDEEQRFGVKQKERLKLISNGIDVLTLTATPIPRTLQMSLSGIRDTSTIRSPPPMRKPTITYVQDFSENMVREAITRELDRGGQCYYVVPRISMLDEAEEVMLKLFPDLRIIQAHGRMQRGGAEDNVARFAEGGYDVLLATTVIENGVDIPTVNTIIVQNSQAFGMSTLYQLRGRVGRSDKQGYAFFLHREESITEQAAMRLQAIGELSELGSGFDVANRDLEIRGAGSLLGTEQSGMAAKVGFDLYMRMLKKSIRKLRGLDLPLVPRTNVLIDTGCTPSSFKIPLKYVPDDTERRQEESKVRLAESTAKLVNITNAWKDEYGNLPRKLQAQMKTMHLHACTRRLGIDLVGLVEHEEGELECVLRSPGLRPRHWATILATFPKPAAPRGLHVAFPARFTMSGSAEEYAGGKKINLKLLISDKLMSEDQEEEEWDAMDEEEQEALREIASAVDVKSIDEIDLEQYPRIIIKGIESEGKALDRLLKVLLPIAKTVYEKQEAQAEEAKLATELRQKQELLRTRKKKMAEMEEERMGFSME